MRVTEIQIVHDIIFVIFPAYAICLFVYTMSVILNCDIKLNNKY